MDGIRIVSFNKINIDKLKAKGMISWDFLML